MRILISIEPRSYGQVVGSAIQLLRPHLEVVVVEPEDFVPEAERLRPELLLSHLRGSEIPSGRVKAWIELSVEHGRPSAACVDGSIKVLADPNLDDVLSIVEEAEQRFG